MGSLTRRKLLTTTIVIGNMPFLNRVAYGQQAISESKRRLIAELPGAFPPFGQFSASPDAIDQFAETENVAIRTYAESAQRFDAAQVDADINPGSRQLISVFSELDVPLVPDPAEITPLDDSTKPPLPDDTLQSVVADIFIQTLEVEPIKDVIMVVMTEYPPVVQILERIRQAIGLRDVNQIAALIVEICQILAKRDLILFLTQRLGPQAAREAIRDLLKAMGKKLVPFVGWAILLYSFLVVVIRNWDRLVRVVSR